MKKNILKLSLLVLLTSSSLMSSDTVIGVYGGSSSENVKIERDTTASSNTKYKVDKTNSMVGLYIGSKTPGFKSYISYDVSGDKKTLKLQRLLLNADIYLNRIKQDFMTPFIGAGVGYAYNDYTIDGYETSQTNGLVSGRGGLNFEINKNNSIELVYEYSHMVTSGHKGNKIYALPGFNYQRDSIISQNSSQFKIAYQYEF